MNTGNAKNPRAPADGDAASESLSNPTSQPHVIDQKKNSVEATEQKMTEHYTPQLTENAAPKDDANSEGAATEMVVEAGTPLSSDEVEQLTGDIVAALKTVYDPEIPSDIYELGLIYKVELLDNRDIEVEMTLTSPGCPVAGEMPGWVQNAVASVPGVGEVTVNLVFDPPWHMDRMSDEAKLALNMF